MEVLTAVVLFDGCYYPSQKQVFSETTEVVSRMDASLQLDFCALKCWWLFSFSLTAGHQISYWSVYTCTSVLALLLTAWGSVAQ